MHDTIAQIQLLRRQKNAVILAHTYQAAEIQQIADFVGDSLALSLEASRVKDAELIVFCGVLFMAETAAILNPRRKVIMPDTAAGCPMADMISAEQLRHFKAEHAGAKVVCYVNSTAEVKAESDICCTSSNAVKVVSSLGTDQEIIFVPDQYLGKFIEKQTGQKMILWEGYCPVHEKLSADMTKEAKSRFPGVPLMVHPETRPEVQELADYILSTGQMIKLAKESKAQRFLVGTEMGIMHALQNAAPDKQFIHLNACLLCPDMKVNNLPKLLNALQNEETHIRVPQPIADKARLALQRMLDLS